MATSQSKVVNRELKAVYDKLHAKMNGQQLIRHGKHRVLKLNKDQSITVIFYKTEIMTYHPEGRLVINCYAEVQGRGGIKYDGTQATALQFEKAVNEITEESVLFEYNSTGTKRYSTMYDIPLPKGVELVNNERS